MSELNERLGFAVLDGLPTIFNANLTAGVVTKIEIPLPANGTAVGVRCRLLNPSTTGALAYTFVKRAADGTSVAPTMNATAGDPNCGILVPANFPAEPFALAGLQTRDLYVVVSANGPVQLATFPVS